MATPIQPTGQVGKRREAERQAREVWQHVQPEAWNALSAAQRWEIVRRVIVYLLRQQFKNLPGG